MCIHIYVCVFLWICAYACILHVMCMWVGVNVLVHVYVYVYMYAHVHVYAYVYVHSCACVSFADIFAKKIAGKFQISLVVNKQANRYSIERFIQNPMLDSLAQNGVGLSICCRKPGS